MKQTKSELGMPNADEVEFDVPAKSDSHDFRISKIGKVKLQDGDQWFDAFSFRVENDTRNRILVIASDEARRHETVVKALALHGAARSHEIKFPEAVARAVFSEPPRTGTVIVRNGWVGAPGTRFALPFAIVGDDEISLDLLNLNFDDRQNRKGQLVAVLGDAGLTLSGMGRKGTAKNWKTTVAETAKSSSLIMFSISAALAAPMLRLMNEEGFAIILTGPSSTGKTKATLAAASVIGYGQERDIPPFFTSEAGIAERADWHNDLLFPMDDVGKSGLSGLPLFQLVSNLAYRSSTGAQKVVQTSSKAASTHRPHPRGGICNVWITSSELSLSDMARLAARSFQDGVYARLYELASLPRTEGGVFDKLPRGGDIVARARACAIKLQAQCADQYGAIQVKWLGKIVADPTRAIDRVRRYSDDMLQRLTRNESNALAIRRAQSFALVYGSAAYAIERKLLPWSFNELREAVTNCFMSSQATFPDPSALLRDGKARLKSLLSDRNRVPLSDRPVKDSFGGWKTAGDRFNVYCVFGSHWTRAFASKEQQKAVEQYLLCKRILQGTSGGLTFQARLPGGGKAARFYRLKYSKKAKPGK